MSAAAFSCSGAGGAFEGIADELTELGAFERFLDEPGDAFAGESLTRLRLVVAAHDDDGEVRADGADVGEGLLATHAGHGEVQEDDGHLIAVLAQDLDAFAAIFGREDAEAGALDHPGNDPADDFVVIDDGHYAGCGPPCRRQGGRRTGGGGQEDFERRAVAKLAVDLDGAAVAPL